MIPFAYEWRQSVLSGVLRRGSVLFAGGADMGSDHRKWTRGAVGALVQLAKIGGVVPDGLPRERQLAKTLHPKEVFFALRLPNQSGSEDPEPGDAAIILDFIARMSALAIGTPERHDAQRWLIKGNIAAAFETALDAPTEALRAFGTRFAEDWLQEFERSDQCIVGCPSCVEVATPD